MKISRLAANLGDSPTLKLNAKAGQLREQGLAVIHLGGGEPESPAPADAVRAAIAKLNTGRVKYTPVGGTGAAKKAVLGYTKKYYGKDFAPENVLVSGGAKQALYNFLLAVVDPGDEVVFPAPYWVSYPEMIKMCGGLPVSVAPKAGTFTPEIADVEKAFSLKTRALILNSPNNPSGNVYTAEFVKQAVELCERRNVLLVMDDIYHQLVFGGKKAVSVFEFVKKPENVVVINGVSKLYGMTGFRIGWAVAEKTLIAAMNKIQGQTTSCPSDLSQAATVGALEGDQTCIDDLRKSLVANRDLLIAELSKMKKLRLIVPDGTFYCLPDFSAYNKDSAALCAFLLEKALVVTVPGKSFGMEGHLRISYCGRGRDIVEGARRIRWALDPDSPKEIIIGGKTFERTW